MRWSHSICSFLLLGLAGHCQARLPSTAEFDSAVAAARPEAKALGLTLRTDGLWRTLLTSRGLMMAQVQAGECHIAYNPYTPGRSFVWLFPPMAVDDAAAWLGGLVRHELAHCVDPGLAAPAAVAVSAGAARGSEVDREAFADLAFALHVDHHSANATTLITRFADLRAAMAPHDPGHNTAAVLRCYLQHPARALQSTEQPPPWPTLLQTWQQRCPLPRPD